jgi:hypothetical protein
MTSNMQRNRGQAIPAPEAHPSLRQDRSMASITSSVV